MRLPKEIVIPTNKIEIPQKKREPNIAMIKISVPIPRIVTVSL